MIYIFIALIAVAFTMLGALTVWVGVLSLALKALLIVPVVFALYLLWNRYDGRRS